MKKKEFHILALDGGGSKGLMQALILQDVMNATTVISQNPDRVLEILQKEAMGNHLQVPIDTRAKPLSSKDEGVANDGCSESEDGKDGKVGDKTVEYWREV